jgi:hypothetical protein
MQHTRSVAVQAVLARMAGVAKVPMRVIAEPPEGTREVLVAEHPGSMVIEGNDGAKSFLCGNCRDVLVKSVDPDEWVTYEHNPAAECTDHEFTPLYRVRDIVFRCKGCGSYNEVAG